MDPPQQDLQVSDDPYRTMVQYLSDVVWVLDRETGLVRYVSPSIERVFGHSPASLVGTDPFVLIHPDDRARQWAHFLQVRRRRGVPPADIFRFADATGTYRDVETVGSAPDDGAEVILAMRDISRRVQAERELAARESRFRTLADLAPVAIFEMDAQGSFVYANERLLNLAGLRSTDRLDELWPSLVAPEDLERVATGWARSLERLERYEVQVRLQHADRTERQLLCRADPVRDGEGNVTGWIGTAEDVTALVEAMDAARAQADELERVNLELRASQAAAAQANRAKNEFLSRMSHELRTPLNSILGFAQLLEQGGLRPEDEREAVTLIRSSGRHLLNLIEEVLDISRIESGGMSLSLEPVDVAHIVSDAVRVLGPEAALHGVELRIEGGPTEYVRADRQRLLQVLLNLLSNAVKYNRRGGWVAVSHAADTDTVRLSVRDSGRGIAPDDLNRLFEPFERLDAAAIGVTGTGLGLTVTKALLEQMGGTLEVVSAVGKGTTFTAVLPAIAEVRTETGPVPAIVLNSSRTDEAPAPGRPRKVLYIEDNPVNFRLVERALQSRPNVEVIKADTGRAGLAAAAREHPDLILLDLHLPDLSGFDVLAELRADPVTAELPVTVLTADATPGLRQRVTADGRTGYLTKPLQLPDLLAEVDRATVSP